MWIIEHQGGKGVSIWFYIINNIIVSHKPHLYLVYLSSTMEVAWQIKIFHHVNAADRIEFDVAEYNKFVIEIYVQIFNLHQWSSHI